MSKSELSRAILNALRNWDKHSGFNFVENDPNKSCRFFVEVSVGGEDRLAMEKTHPFAGSKYIPKSNSVWILVKMPAEVTDPSPFSKETAGFAAVIFVEWTKERFDIPYNTTAIDGVINTLKRLLMRPQPKATFYTPKHMLIL